MLVNIGIFMAFSSIYCHPSVQSCLAPKQEFLNSLGQLPITNDSSHMIYLVRHGESTANLYFEVGNKKVRYISGQSLDISLTDLGKEQIRGLANELAERFPIKTKLIIVSSAALRTQQTANILFEELSKTHPYVTLSNQLYTGLNERSLGIWEGRIKDENYTKAESIWRAMPAVDKFNSSEVSGGESYEQVANRALIDLCNIYHQYSNFTVIAVTSFNTINASAIEIQKPPLSNKPETNLPKIDLGNGDLVLLETSKNAGFKHTQVTSHIRYTSK